MAIQRKLSRPTDQRMAILRSQATALIQHGRIETTETRAKEIRTIVEKIISDCVNEVDNFTSEPKTISRPKVTLGLLIVLGSDVKLSTSLTQSEIIFSTIVLISFALVS